MAISSALITMVRVLVNDLEEEDYSDCRLEQIIAVAAYQTQIDLGTSNYTIDIEGQDITPNPFSNNDSGFINLIALKTACIIDQGTYRTKAALAGLSATCGPANLKVGNGNITAYKDLLNMGACALYKEMLIDYKLHGNGANGICHAILSPFISNDFDPSSINGYSNKDFYR